MNAKMTRAIYNENKIWFADHRYAALFCYDIATRNCEFLSYLTPKEIHQTDEIAVAAKFENKVITIPVRGTVIIVYDLYDNSIRQYPVIRRTEGVGFCNAIAVDKCLWIMPCKERMVLCFDMDAESVKYYEDSNHVIPDAAIDEEIFGYSIYANNSIWMPCLLSDIIVDFDLNSFEFNMHHINQEKYKCAAMAFCGGHFYILTEGIRQLVEWMPDGSHKVIGDTPYKNDDEWSVYKIHSFGDELLFMPYYGSAIWVFNVLEKRWKKLADKPLDSIYEEAVRVENNIYGFDEENGVNFVWNRNTDEMIFFEIEYSKNLEGLLTDMNFAGMSGSRSIIMKEGEREYSDFLVALSKWRY